MKRLGPPNGDGPRSETNLRVAGEHSHSRSDSGRASSTFASSPSPPKPTASADHLAGTALNVVLTAQGRGRFDVSLNDTPIVKASAQPICEAARVLHRNARHEGSSHHAISSRLGFWRKRRIREDRGMPRYVRWEPRPRRVDAKNGRGKVKGAEHRAEKKNASTTTPGASKGQSAVLRPPPRPRPEQP